MEAPPCLTLEVLAAEEAIPLDRIESLAYDHVIHHSRFERPRSGNRADERPTAEIDPVQTTALGVDDHQAPVEDGSRPSLVLPKPSVW